MWDDTTGRLVKQIYSWFFLDAKLKHTRVALFNKESHILIVKELAFNVETYPIENYLAMMANDGQYNKTIIPTSK